MMNEDMTVEEIDDLLIIEELNEFFNVKESGKYGISINECKILV